MGAAVTIKRHLQWMDTDAAGIWHHSTAIRLTEDAETTLHRLCGTVEETIGRLPRVHVEFDYSGRVAFDQQISITLSVAAVGRTSIEYHIVLNVGEREVGRGKLIGVLVDENAAARPWPGWMRERLLEDQHYEGD